jgi:hypothetical protein
MLGGIALVVVAVAFACEGIDLVDISHDQDLPLPPGLQGQPLVDEVITSPEGFDPLSSPEMEKYGGPAAAIGEASVVEATLEVTEGAPNLDFLDSIEFWVKTANSDPVLLASEPNVPAGKQWIELQVDDNVDLTDLVDDGEMFPEMVISGTGPDEATILNVAFTVSLGVSVESTCDAIFGG